MGVHTSQFMAIIVQRACKFLILYNCGTCHGSQMQQLHLENQRLVLCQQPSLTREEGELVELTK